VNIIPQAAPPWQKRFKPPGSRSKDKTDNHKVLVLFTDGEDHDGHAVDAAKEALKTDAHFHDRGRKRNGELLRVTDAARRTIISKTRT